MISIACGLFSSMPTTTLRAHDAGHDAGAVDHLVGVLAHHPVIAGYMVRTGAVDQQDFDLYWVPRFNHRSGNTALKPTHLPERHGPGSPEDGGKSAMVRQIVYSSCHRASMRSAATPKDGCGNISHRLVRPEVARAGSRYRALAVTTTGLSDQIPATSTRRGADVLLHECRASEVSAWQRWLFAGLFLAVFG